MNWADKANCAGTDTEAFFPEKGAQARDAKRVCMRCPVRVECLAWSISDIELRYGIWGGLNQYRRGPLRSLVFNGADPMAVAVAHVA